MTSRRDPWPGSIPARLRFERGARAAFPSLRSHRAGRRSGGFGYRVVVDLPYHEDRSVSILFPTGAATPTVFADGPTDSPHRFDDGSLCMWHPADPPNRRWRMADGLLDLLDTIRGHLLREAIWRETGEWPGEEAPHQPVGGGGIA